MAKQINRLSARSVQALLDKPGRYADGGGLYLNTKGGHRWVFLFRWRGKLKEMGLGSAAPGHVSLKDARDRASIARGQLDKKINPLEAKRREQKAVPTFGTFAESTIGDLAEGFSNQKHRDQWSNTLETHAASIWKMPVNEIETEEVLSVLKPIWAKIPETASRVRGRIERILSAAKVQGYRAGENPARWRGHLDQLLPKRNKSKKKHHPALPFDKLPAFIVELREREAVAARALEFLILSATRGNETRGARWEEFDFDRKVWTIPAERMKAKRPHRVPLTPRMLALLDEMKAANTSDFVFLGPDRKRPLSEGAFKTLLDRMDHASITPHGFRSTFRDWSSEKTHFANEVAEMALAHTIRDETEAAYRRGDLFEKRRKLMTAWGDYCALEIGRKAGR